MQRMNIFEPAHLALKDVLYSTALRLQRIDVHVKAESFAALVQVQRSLEHMERHRRLETTHVFMPLFEYEPSIVEGFLQQGESSTGLTQAVKTCLQEISQSGHPTASPAAWKKLTAAYTDLVSFSLQQMKSEEEVLSSILWCYYGDWHLTAMQQQLETGPEGGCTRIPVASPRPTSYQRRKAASNLLHSLTAKPAV